jgi:hypothetical protein
MQSNHSPNSVQTGSAPAAQANNYGAPAALVWANTVIATLGAAAGIVALALVLIRLDDYAAGPPKYMRLITLALDELRVEANVSRKLAGRPAVDSHSHD